MNSGEGTQLEYKKHQRTVYHVLFIPRIPVLVLVLGRHIRTQAKRTGALAFSLSFSSLSVSLYTYIYSYIYIYILMLFSHEACIDESIYN